MARGFVNITIPQLHLFSTTPWWAPSFVSLFCRRRYTRFSCNTSSQNYNGIPFDIKRRRFAKRMQLAGLEPHHPIAMGVSGGADSMALCVLMAHWKSIANTSAVDSSGFINGLLAIIVDHGLRPESTEEANTVSSWLTDMGIRSEIAHCTWPNGLPKTSHLEEMARDMRYEIFRDVCFRYQIGVLLIAHHADDQAELFILRLSRNSGVLGLAGMAFASQLFPKFPLVSAESSNNQGILVVRPLLDFTKEDLYEICEKKNQKWVEDPTNKSSLFTRNRIRMALQDMKSCTFRNELQELISLCRRTRLYVDHICQILLNQAVTVMPHGYVVIDLENLNSSKIEDICLSRFLALVLQFVSQRHRPVRGSALKLLLDYTRTFPCKTSLTAAGCYLCAAPGSKGTKVLVCCSVNSALPSNTDLYSRCPGQGTNEYIPSYVEQIIIEQRSQLKPVISDCSDVHFLEAASSDSVLGEARKLNFISESTYETITELQKDESDLFKARVQSESSSKSKTEQQVPYINDLFQSGQRFYFMNRFFLIWTSRGKRNSCDSFSDDGEGTQNQICNVCLARDTVAYIRHMIDEDWLYLAKLSKTDESSKFKQQKFEQVTDKTSLCSEHRKLSAEQALKTLKSIPVAARRGLPVIVRVGDGVVLNIPSIGFKHCSSLVISAQFRPRVPLGGGHSSFT